MYSCARAAHTHVCLHARARTQVSGDFFLKPASEKSDRFENERAFLRQLKEAAKKREPIAAFAPTYYGTVRLRGENGKREKYLKMSNLLCGFDEPCAPATAFVVCPHTRARLPLTSPSALSSRSLAGGALAGRQCRALSFSLSPPAPPPPASSRAPGT